MSETVQKKALVFGVKVPWDKSRLPPDHFASYLVKKGYAVSYITDDISLFHLIKWGLNRKVLTNIKLLLTGQYRENSINYFARFILFPEFKVNRFYRYLNKHTNFTISSCRLRSLLVEKFDVVWSSSYRNINLFLNMDAGIKFFSIEDNVSGFNILPDERIEYVESALQTDSVTKLCTSLCLIRDKYQDAHYYSNGINEHFEILPFKNGPGGKACVYVGAIEDWFDWKLVNRVFSNLANDGFTLDIYGFSNGKVEDHIEADNIRYCGGIDHTAVQATLARYDIGIIPFSVNELISYVNPIKLYEYLASGLKVMSVKWKELIALQPGCTVLATPKSFEQDLVLLSEYTFCDDEVVAMQDDLQKRRYSLVFEELLQQNILAGSHLQHSSHESV